MGFLIGFLTFVMVVNCVVLCLLVLVQLPKKEAGMGLAFGGSASDALFGAGSGNVLTRITKYSAGVFFVLAILLAGLQSSYHTRHTTAFEQGLSHPAQTAPSSTMPAPPTPELPAAQSKSPAGSVAMPLLPETNASAKPLVTAPAAGAGSSNSAPAPAAPK